MADHPLLFRPEMVRALLEGRKTQTRRPAWKGGPLARVRRERDRTAAQRIKVGDRVWVRETLRCDDTMLWRYAADNANVRSMRATGDWADRQKRDVVPSIHMPLWASRITLLVTGVKIERLQDISEQDAIAEGVKRTETMATGRLTKAWWDYLEPDTTQATARASYRTLYASIHGPDGWKANPEVVAITFTVHRRNIDALKAAP